MESTECSDVGVTRSRPATAASHTSQRDRVREGVQGTQQCAIEPAGCPGWAASLSGRDAAAVPVAAHPAPGFRVPPSAVGAITARRGGCAALCAVVSGNHNVIQYHLKVIIVSYLIPQILVA